MNLIIEATLGFLAGLLVLVLWHATWSRLWPLRLRGNCMQRIRITSRGSNIKPGEYLRFNGVCYWVEEADADTLTCQRVGRWESARMRIRQCWPLRLRGFWARVWTR